MTCKLSELIRNLFLTGDGGSDPLADDFGAEDEGRGDGGVAEVDAHRNLFIQRRQDILADIAPEVHGVHVAVSELAAADGQEQLGERQPLPRVDCVVALVLGILEGESPDAQPQLGRLPQQIGALWQAFIWSSMNAV